MEIDNGWAYYLVWLYSNANKLFAVRVAVKFGADTCCSTAR